MFKQLLTPVGDSLGLSFIVAALAGYRALLLLLGVLAPPGLAGRRWPASSSALLVADRPGRCRSISR